MLWSGAHGTQDCHFATPLIQAGENRCQHAQQPGQHHKRRHHHQRCVDNADQVPQLLQRHAWNNGQQRLLPIFVNSALHRESHNARTHAQQKCRDGVGCEIACTCLFGADALLRHGLYAALPVNVQRGDGL